MGGDDGFADFSLKVGDEFVESGELLVAHTLAVEVADKTDADGNAVL